MTDQSLAPLSEFQDRPPGANAVARSVIGLDRMRLALAERRADTRDCLGQIMNDQHSLQAEDAITKTSELALTAHIRIVSAFMVRAIHFNDELLRRSQEVDDEAVGNHHCRRNSTPKPRRRSACHSSCSLQVGHWRMA
jgi:hypothetical protein